MSCSSVYSMIIPILSSVTMLDIKIVFLVSVAAWYITKQITYYRSLPPGEFYFFIVLV